MGTYLDYTVEVKEHGKWKCVGKVSYTDLEPNPYILKSYLWDCEFFTDTLKSIKDLTEDTVCMFARKIPKKDSLLSQRFNRYDPKIPYPYTGVKNFTIYNASSFSDMIEALEKYSIEDAESKFNDTWIGIKPEGIDKYWDNISKYLGVETGTEKGIENLVKQNKVPNVVTSFGGKYYLTTEGPFNALCYIRDYGMLRDIENKEEVLTGEIVQITYTDCFGKQIDQYAIPYCGAKVSYVKDVEAMINDLQRNIKRNESSRDVDNLVKNKIKELLTTVSDEDQKTELFKELNEYANSAEDVESEEYLDELKEQLAEILKIRFIMGDTGRLIWNIE